MWPQFAAFEQPHTPQAQFAYGAILGVLTRRGNAGVARGHGASGGGRYLFYCTAVSLRRRDKGRDGGMTDKAKEIWVSGEAYEQYVGRWSRKVAREFLAGLKCLEGKRGETSAAELVLSSTRSSPGMNRSPSWPSTGRTDSSPTTQHGISASRVLFEVSDATALPWPNGSCDVTVSGLVLNFVSDAGSMTREMARVTRPGGRVAAHVLGLRSRHAVDAAFLGCRAFS